MKITLGRRAATVVALASLTAGLAGALAAGAAATTSDLPAPRATGSVSVVHSPSPVPLLLNTRTAKHHSYDRVVLDVSGGLPGYHVRYVPKLRYDGSGKLVPLSGRAFLQITLNPAMAHTGDSSLNVYCCSRLFHPRLANVSGVALTGDFEGYVSVGLALRHRAGFRVRTLSNPTRIVVDVAR